MREINQQSYLFQQHLTVLPQEDIVWCPVFKAATSSWRGNLLALSHLPAAEQEKLRKSNPYNPGAMIKPLTRPINSASSYQELTTKFFPLIFEANL